MQRKFIPHVPISDWAQPVAIVGDNKAGAQIPAVLLQAVFAIPQFKQTFQQIRLGQNYADDEVFARECHSQPSRNFYMNAEIE